MRAKLGGRGTTQRRRNLVFGSLLGICCVLSLFLVRCQSRRDATAIELRNSVREPLKQEWSPAKDDTTTEELKWILRGEPVVDVGHYLDSCPQNKATAFHETIVEPRLAKGSTTEPALPAEFVCQAQCARVEPELEHSLKYLGGTVTKYTATSISSLCRKERVPLLVRIVNGKVQWAKCGAEKLKATHLWFTVRRTLFALSRMVTLSDVLFAFDNSDFSRPYGDDPHGLSWLYIIPGVIRFVGDSSHPSLLWPTSPYIKTTAYCNIDVDSSDKRPGEAPRWIKPGGCDRASKLSWEEKSNLLFWRGSPTGFPIDDDHVQFMPRSMLNRQFAGKEGYDIAFLKEAIPPYANPKFMSTHVWAKGVSREDFGKYKMTMSLDGHTASWGLIERLGLGSLLLVHESLRGYREFYYALLRPYEHFVPVSFDFTNLETIRRWVLSPEGGAKARTIAENAQRLIGERMRPEDMWCYLYRMLETLSSKQAFSVTDPEFDSFKWFDITETSVQSYTSKIE